jgi:hypothetical protein
LDKEHQVISSLIKKYSILIKNKFFLLKFYKKGTVYLVERSDGELLALKTIHMHFMTAKEIDLL